GAAGLFSHNYMLVVVAAFVVLAGHAERLGVRRREEMRVAHEFSEEAYFRSRFDPRERDEVFPPRTAEPRPGPRPVSTPTPRPAPIPTPPQLIFWTRAVEMPDPPH